MPRKPIIEMENQMQQRVNAIIQRADGVAIVQVQIKPRKVSADLPMFGMTAQVTPMNFDGQMSSATIESVKIRVISQLESVPEWIKAEIVRATEIPGVKVEIAYEKAAGQLTNERAEMAKIARDISDSAMNSLNQVKMGVWGLMGTLTLCLLIVAYAVFFHGKTHGILARAGGGRKSRSRHAKFLGWKRPGFAFDRKRRSSRSRACSVRVHRPGRS